MKRLIKNVDCIELYVSDIDEGLKYYINGMGLKLLWRNETMAGLGMVIGITEIVLQCDRKQMNVDFKVDSVIEAIDRIKELGGKVIYGPFDIPIGKCAVIRDIWKNEYVILDMSKGKYVTDKNGKVVGVRPLD